MLRFGAEYSPKRTYSIARRYIDTRYNIDVAVRDEQISTAMVHILLCLAQEDCHGYGIMQRSAERLGPGTLYGALKRMLTSGWVEESGAVDEADSRRRFYRIAPKGRDALAAELGRMRAIVDHPVARKITCGLGVLEA